MQRGSGWGDLWAGTPAIEAGFIGRERTRGAPEAASNRRDPAPRKSLESRHECSVAGRK
jgi:hypothetical protein